MDIHQLVNLELASGSTSTSVRGSLVRLVSIVVSHFHFRIDKPVSLLLYRLLM